MSVRYFVDRYADGSVSHLVRVTETATTLEGEFLVDGRWVADGSAMDYVHDRTLGEEVDEARADEIVAELGGSSPVLDGPRAAAIRAGLAALLPDGAPVLPDPIPPRGTLTGDGWKIAYVVGVDAGDGLDVLAEHRLGGPIHAHLAGDGTAVVLDSFEYEYGYDPDVEGAQEAADARMQAHNRRVHDELARKGLI